MAFSSIFPLLVALALAAFWFLVAWGAAIIGMHKGEHPLKWFVLGLICGPFAWLGAFYAGKVCPHCRSKIHHQARICPRCRRPQSFEALSAEDFTPPPETLLAQSGQDVDT